METATLVIAILGLVFGLLGMIAAGVTAVIVIGWKNSTHQIQYQPVPETKVELDIPPDIAAQLGDAPGNRTVEQYVRKLRAQATLDDLYEET